VVLYVVEFHMEA